MYQKLCPKCHQHSYSSSETSQWPCPTCNHDLIYIKHQIAGTPKQNTSDLSLIINRSAKPKRKSQVKVFPRFD